MLTAEPDSGLICHNVDPPSGEVDASPLEKMVVGLESCRTSDEQIRLLVDTVRQTTSADLAFWFREAPKPKIVCDESISHRWCIDVSRSLLSASETFPPLPLSRGVTAAPRAASAAMLRISRRKRSWLVAVGTDASKPLNHTDVGQLRLARRILRNHRRQTALFNNLRNTLFGLIQGLTKALEAKDPYTCGHSERVARIGVRLAEMLGLDEQQVGDIYLAGLLHDIGKIGIRDDVLVKPGPLSESEYLHIQQHPIIGDRILRGITQLEHLIPGVRSHHERIDGDGYPDGLAGDQIPLMAKILAAADACDAMMSPRSYRPALSATDIVAIMRAGAGRQWDVRVIDAFMQCKERLFSICEKGLGDSVHAALDRRLPW